MTDPLIAELATWQVCVELDGLIAHPRQQHWDDQHRDNAAAASGLVTLRYNWAGVTQRPCVNRSPPC